MNYVYYLLDPGTQSILYVGRSTKPAKRLWSFIDRTGVTAILGVSQRYSDFDQACSAELKAIRKHQPPHNKIMASCSGYLGYQHTPAAKERIRLASMGHTLSLTGREKVRLATLGHKRNLGKKHSAETKAKIGASRSAAYWKEHHEVRQDRKTSQMAASP